MKKINLLYNIWFGSVIGTIVDLSMNFLYFKGGHKNSIIILIEEIIIASLIGIFISLSGDYLSFLIKKIGIKKRKILLSIIYSYNVVIIVSVCYFFNVKEIYLYITAILIMLIFSSTISYIENLRAKELNKNLNVAKERYRKTQEME